MNRARLGALFVAASLAFMGLLFVLAQALAWALENGWLPIIETGPSR